MHDIQVDAAPWARQYDLEELVNPRFHGKMYLDILVLACPLDHPTVYPSMAVFSSSNKASILHLIQELDEVSFYNVRCNPIKILSWLCLQTCHDMSS